MAGTKKKIEVTLACEECKERNYRVPKSKRKARIKPYKLELMKFCKHCKKQTLHKETK